MKRNRIASLAFVLILNVIPPIAAVGKSSTVIASDFLSHPPMRPLPAAIVRPNNNGPAYFVDAVKGSNANNGSKKQPWKTLTHAVRQLKPGDTLYLHGGKYYEHVTIECKGTYAKPITIRSYPGELAIIDGGLREFFDMPAAAWTPYRGGAPGEFRSVKKYPMPKSRPDQTNLLGNFGDSMIPLHGYRFVRDFRSDDMYWRADIRTNKKKGVWCGPGLWHDTESGHIHVRLAHTNLKGLGRDNYKGETDPRKAPLVVAGFKGGSPLTIRGASFVIFQDLVVRGAREATIDIDNCENLIFDGLTVYGGSTAFRVKDTWGLRIVNTACRGIAAPWTFRSSLKYRSIEARIFSASSWQVSAKGNRDFEIAYSEFTDCVDGIFVGNVKGVRFHHNLVDNVSDDAIFLTATTGLDGLAPGGGHLFYQNLLSRSLTIFAFGAGHGRQKAIKGGRQTGAGAHIFRNIVDLRGPAMYFQPSGPKAPQELTSHGRFASDHGGPTWEPMWIYHNTIIDDQQRGYAYGALGLGDHVGNGAKRRVFNNIVVQINNPVSMHLPEAATDFHARGNLFWSMKHGKAIAGNAAAHKRFANIVAQSKKTHPPGWTDKDHFADPKFVRFESYWRKPFDLSLMKGSPAIDSGISLSSNWPNGLGIKDSGLPDRGAIPFGVAPWRVGVRGRLTMFGGKSDASVVRYAPMRFSHEIPKKTQPIKTAAIVKGYPAFDAPLLKFALRKNGVPVKVFEKTWLDCKKYHNYSMVSIAGGLTRARMKTTRFSSEDLKIVRQFLKNGGTLLIQRASREVFATPHGRAFLTELTGTCPPTKGQPMQVVPADHPWIKHLKRTQKHSWLSAKRHEPLRTNKGEVILGTPGGYATLYRVPVGKGQLIYYGWDIASSQPRRDVNTIEQERIFAEQTQIVFNMVDAILPAKEPRTK